MFSSGFAFDLASVGARLRQDELRADDLRVLRMRHEGGLVDESLDRPCGARSSAWTRVRFVLAGPIHVRLARGVDVEPGQAHASAAFRIETGRALTVASDWLDLYWRTGSAVGSALPTGAVFRLSAAALSKVRTLAVALERRDVTTAIAPLYDVLCELQAEGLPVRAEALPAIAASADPSSSELARIIWQLLGRLDERPMAVDLARALGVSERHALRRANRHLERFHVGAASWREVVGCLRLELGAFFMSAPSARVEDVSRFLGFASPTGFCHALHEAGLPSPLRLREAVRSA